VVSNWVRLWELYYPWSDGLIRSLAQRVLYSTPLVCRAGEKAEVLCYQEPREEEGTGGLDTYSTSLHTTVFRCYFTSVVSPTGCCEALRTGCDAPHRSLYQRSLPGPGTPPVSSEGIKSTTTQVDQYAMLDYSGKFTTISYSYILHYVHFCYPGTRTVALTDCQSLPY